MHASTLNRPITHKFNQTYDSDSFEQKRIDDFIRVTNRLAKSEYYPYILPITVIEDEEEPGGKVYETSLYYLDFQITDDGEFTAQLQWKDDPINDSLYFEILPDHFELREDVRDPNNKQITNSLLFTF